MNCEVIDTALGSVPMWMRGKSGGPLVVVIRGAFPDEHDLEWLDVPGAQMVFVHLPGFFSPNLVVTSIGAFVAAFSEALNTRFPGQSYAAVGLSTGALVALALPNAACILAIEPFLSTQEIWPMHIFFNLKFRDRETAESRWATAIFGFRDVPRDYSGVLENLSSPAIALLGDQALLPQRHVRWMPSLCSDADRRILREQGVRLVVVNGGHNLVKDNPDAISSITRQIVRREFEQAK